MAMITVPLINYVLVRLFYYIGAAEWRSLINPAAAIRTRDIYHDKSPECLMASCSPLSLGSLESLEVIKVP